MTNIIDYGNKIAENGYIDAGKHETLYFHASTDNEWFNINNWYSNSSYTVLANKFPTENDIVIINDENIINTSSKSIAIGYLSVHRSGYGVSWSNILQLDFGSTLDITCIYGASFVNDTDYVGGYLINYATITSPSISFNLCINYGFLESNSVTFDVPYWIWTDIGNYGTINGNVVFNNGGSYWNILRNWGIVNGSCTFNSNAVNNGLINGTCTLNNSINENTIEGIANLYGNSYNNATINGSATFYDNSGNDSGSVTGEAIFNNYSYLYNSTIDGNVTFNDSSYASYSTINGDATFYVNSSIENMTINGNIIFNDFSHNSLGCVLYVSGIATFNNYSYNDYYATIYGNAIFNDSSYNQSGAIINGNATFNNNSNNYGTVTGTTTCNTTGVCVDSNPNPNGSSTSPVTSLLMHFDSTDTISSINVTSVRIYSVFAGLRSANYTVQYSDDNSTWTTAFSGIMSNNSNCGLQNGSGTGDGSYGSHQYWRYVEGNAIEMHHPRCSRIDFIDNNNNIYNLVTYTSDNCNDTGEYQIGTVSKNFLTFSDSSLSRNVINSQGTAAISTTQSKFGGSSGYFPGNANRLTIVDQEGFTINGDFTIEAWLKPTYWNLGFEGNYWMSQCNNIANNSNRSWGVYIYDQRAGFYYSQNGATDNDVYFTASDVQINQWVHYAASIQNGVLRLFINGLLVGTQNILPGGIFNSTADLCIGTFGKYAEDGYNGLSYTGYIDELRIVKGAALYTSNFTPSSAPYQDPEQPYPSLLMHFDLNVDFNDSSLNNFSHTLNGYPVVIPSQSKFGGASGHFDGASSLEFQNNPEFNLSSSPCTIESWFYPESAAFDLLSINSLGAAIISKDQWGSNLSWAVIVAPDGIVFASQNGAGLVVQTNITANTWHHIAITYDGTSNVSIFLDGNLVTSQIFPLTDADSIITVGRSGGTSNPNSFFTGYIDELRIVKGKAIYTSNFVPPTAPYSDPIVPNLLLNFEGAEGSTTFTDSGPNNLDGFQYGAASITTANHIIGSSSSLYLPNALSYVGINQNDNLDLSNGNFTIDFWVYPQNQTVNYPSILGTPSWITNNSFSIRYSDIRSQNSFSVHSGAILSVESSDWYIAGEPVSLNKWYHVAIVRNNNIDSLFVNGILQDSYTHASTPNWPNLGYDGILKIGNSWDNYNGQFIGNIDNLRIISGTALYTSNFVPS